MVPVRTMKVHELAYGCQEFINNEFSAIRLQIFSREEILSGICSNFVFERFNFYCSWSSIASLTFMVIYIGCQETMNLNFFQSFNRSFSPLKYVRSTYFTLFQPRFKKFRMVRYMVAYFFGDHMWLGYNCQDFFMVVNLGRD